MSEAKGPINPETAYEPSDASPRLLAGIMALVAVVVIASGAILSGIFSSTLREPWVGMAKPPPRPRLEIDEHADLRRFEARVEKRLDGYGWVDRKRGIVRIPIQEAMKRAAAAGFPDWPGNPPGGARQAAKNAPANAANPPEPPGAVK